MKALVQSMTGLVTAAATVETVDSAGGNSRPTYHNETTILRQLEDIPNNADSDN
jgi:hypothetical protein